MIHVDIPAWAVYVFIGMEIGNAMLSYMAWRKRRLLRKAKQEIASFYENHRKKR